MATVISGRVIKIGNSQGIRIPKLLLEQSGIKENVKIEVRDGQISISAAASPREGWGASFAAMSHDQEVLQLDEVTGTAWDEDQWEW
jgi:antitoxin MazE